MKNKIRWIACLMAMVLMLTMLAGCNNGEGGDDGESVKPITLTIGIPVDNDSPNWTEWESLINQWKEDFMLFEKVTLKFCKVPEPEDKKAVKSFMHKVKRGQVACFFAPQYDYFEEYNLKDESLVPVDSVISRYQDALGTTSDAILTIAREKDLTSYMIPYAGSFQGLYLNTDLVKNLNTKNVTWSALLADCAALKTAGVAPLAAGFKDEGLQYFIEEMILSEGGTSEHSYLPSFGVISSWERAISDINTLKQAGLFGDDAFNKSFDEAKQEFLDGKAAMIVAPSDAFDGQLDPDKTVVIPFPNAPTGKREEGAFIGNIDYGVYIGAAVFNKSDTRYSEMIVTLLGSEYFKSADCYSLYMEDKDFATDKDYYESNAETAYDHAKESLMKNAQAADWPLSERAYAYDAIIDGFRKAFTGSDVEQALQDATDAELSAMAEAEKES